MNTTEEAKRAQWTPIFKEEWISKWTYPNQNVKDKEAVTLDGLTYKSMILAQAEIQMQIPFGYWKTGPKLNL